MKTGLTLKSKPCLGCVRSSHGAHCAWWTTDKCKSLPNMIHPTMYQNVNTPKQKIFGTKLIRLISCDCGRVFFAEEKTRKQTCPDCGFSAIPEPPKEKLRKWQ